MIKHRLFGSRTDVYKRQLKDGVKDKLKGMATLGAVRFTTVQTPKYLVLSGKNLHLFDTDTDGEIDRHFIFDAARLEDVYKRQPLHQSNRYRMQIYPDVSTEHPA